MTCPTRTSRSRGRRRLRHALLGMATVVLLLLLGCAGLLWGTLPASDESPRLAGLSASVEVTMDHHGIPRIAAATERDATMALGWLHARDRMFQMELMRRGAQGRLAEIFGAALLRNDRFVRTLGLARRAAEDLAGLPAETREALEAYAAGVNAWIAARGRFAAPEFLALGAPEPWRPEHSLLWAKVMGLWLSENWRTELDRGRLVPVLPLERLAELWPEDTSPGRPGLALDGRTAGLDPGHLARLAAALPRFPEAGTLPSPASNIWAVAGARSASGAPLLASDPHLGFQAPIIWYLARIDLNDGRMLAGATSPGVPFMVIGRSGRLAWGFTTTYSDTQDIFVETTEGPDAYRTPEGPRPFRVTEEVIRVRGGDPEVLRVRETRHGPVISDLDPNPPAGTVLAVAMANLAPGDSSATGLAALNRADSLAEARAAAALISGVPVNLMVADAAGRIGLYITGRVPLRRAGDGALPSPGAEGSHDWTGWVPFDRMPHVEDPEGGALVNANNRVVPPDSPLWLGRDWPGDWRFRRIGQMLAERPRHDAAGFAAQQMDTLSLLAQELALAPDAPLRRMPRPAGAAGTARDLLLDWDGAISPDRPQPLIFNAWMRSFGRLALAAGGVPEGAWAAGPEFVRFVLAPDGSNATAWCGGDCPGLAARALEAAIAGLQASEGPDPGAWRWGRVHVARFEHPVLRTVPLLGAWAGLAAATGGDGETVFRGGTRGGGRGGDSWTHVHGAGLRLVADLADPDRTLAMIATGQSGHPLSRHWGDLLAGWRDGAMITLGRSPEAVEGRIRLAP